MSSVATSSVKAASLNIMTQVMFRLVTFALNAFVLRHISRDVLGLINVRLNLLDDTIMFLSKEGFRLACLSHSGKEGWQKVINLMWLSVPMSLFWSCNLGLVWVYLLPSPSPHLMTQYRRAVVMVCVSGVWQMLAEPPWVAGQILMYVRLRAALDTLWVMTRVVVLCLAVKYSPDNVVEMWAWGHVLAGVVYVLSYYLAFYGIIRHNNKSTEHSSCEHRSEIPFTSVNQLLPSISNWQLDPGQWTVATSFLGQGIMKQLLTEGEKYMMTIFSLLTLSEQGIFDVVANLGALAARFIFRPVEESAYFFFCQLWVRGVPVGDQDPSNRDKVTTGLYRLLRLVLLLGLTVLSLGVSYSHLLLQLYGGDILTDGAGPDLMRAQCLLILFLAVNGITECFARAVMTDSEINSYTRSMSVMSVAYLLMAWLLTHFLGPVGFVLANCFNMIVRTIFSLNVIRKTYSGFDCESPLSGLSPDNDILFLFLSSGVCCQLSEIWLYPVYPAYHLMLGIVVGLILVSSIIIKEDFIISFIVEKLKGTEEKLRKEHQNDSDEGDGPSDTEGEDNDLRDKRKME